MTRMDGAKVVSMPKVNVSKKWFRCVALPLAALLTVSCASQESPQSDFTPSARNETVDVVLHEWYVLPDKTAVASGNIAFNVANQGRMDHEFIIIRTNFKIEDLPVHARGLDEKKAGVEIGEIENIRPGENKQMTVHLPAGSYLLFCNKLEIAGDEVESHFRRGMHIAFTVR